MSIEIPKGDDNDFECRPNAPAWWFTQTSDGRLLKPIIRCKCGMLCGIRLHHVHKDGTVTASFFHAREGEHPQGSKDGCGWHVFLKLKDYDGPDFPPGSE